MKLRLFVGMGVMALSLMLVGCSMGPMMIQERQSPYDFDKTLETIEQNAEEQGWILAHRFDFQKSLTAHDQPDPGRLVVLKLCQPEIATRMFGQDHTKYVSVMAPCSMAVYEKADGRTYVSAMRMGLMGRLMGGEIAPVMADIAADDEAMLSFLEQ